MGNINRPIGIVLVAAILTLLMVSSIAISVMSASVMDSKMVNAAQDSYRAEFVARGAAELAIKNEIEQGENSQFFKKSSVYINQLITLLNTNNRQVTLKNLNKNDAIDLLDCPPSFSPTPKIKCNYLELTSSVKYGKNNRHTIVIKTGIEQEVAHAF